MACLRKGTIIVAALALLLAPVLLSCGGGGVGGKATITIGYMTDFTGPGAPAVRTLNYIVEDVARYFNDEGLIPGAKIKVVEYDTKSDTSRDIPGYEWLKEHGAHVIISLYAHSTETLRPFAAQDKIPLLTFTGTLTDIQPGWSFVFGNPGSYEMETLLQWISQHDWDYSRGLPKIGLCLWSEPGSIDMARGMEVYCQAHPDQFDWVGNVLVPFGTMMGFSAQVEKLKDCDYIQAPYVAAAMGSFVREFMGRGYHAKFLSFAGQASFLGFLVDSLGWEVLDGWPSTLYQWWNDEESLAKLANELLDRYRPGKRDSIVHEGGSYIGGIINTYPMFDILKHAVENVGIEAFDGQAYYDAAVNYKMDLPDYPQWRFSETKRYLGEDMRIYRYSAEAEGLVRQSDWLPLLTE